MQLIFMRSIFSIFSLSMLGFIMLNIGSMRILVLGFLLSFMFLDCISEKQSSSYLWALLLLVGSTLLWALNADHNYYYAINTGMYIGLILGFVYIAIGTAKDIIRCRKSVS